MSDYVVAVGFETDAGVAKRSTDALADSVAKVGAAQSKAAAGTKDLTSASAELERVQQRIEIQTRKLAEATSAVQRFQARGVTGSKEYTAAVEKQLKAQDQLAASMKKAQEITAGPAQDAAGAIGDEFDKIKEQVAAGAAGIFAGLGLGELITGSVEEFGKLNAGVKDSQDLFGAYAKDIDAFGKNSATAIGLSRTAVLEETNDLGGLFKVLHLGQDVAADMSLQLVKLSTDLGALNGVDPGQVFQAFKSALTGSYDALKPYNVVLTSANVRQEALRLGLIRGKQALNESAQAQAAYSLIIKQTADSQGAFAESGNVVERQQQQLRAALDNAKLELGRGLTPAILGLSHIAENTLLPALKGVGEAVGFIGSHKTTRQIAELLTLLLLTGKAVNLAALAYGRLAASEGAAAVASTRLGAAMVGQRVAMAQATAATAVASTTAGAAAAPAFLGGGKLLKAGGFLIVGTLAGSAIQNNVGGEAGRYGGSIARNAAYGAAIGSVVPGLGTAAGAIAGATGGAVSAALNRPSGPLHELVPLTSEMRSLLARQLTEQQKLPSLFTNAYQDARLTRELLTDQKNRAGRSIAYAQGFLNSPAALDASAKAQPVGGLFDAPAASTKVDLSADNRRVASAQRNVALAQDKLNTLRHSGKATTLQLEAAENRLADARDRLNNATEKTSKDRAKGNQDQSLTADQVLKRADAANRRASAESRNVRKLVNVGLTAEVIEDLKKLETSAPGTIANVAKAITPAFVQQLNHDAAARRKAAQELAALGGQAVLNDAERRARTLAQREAQAYKDTLVAALKDPQWISLVQSTLGKLLLPAGVPGVPGSGQQPAAPMNPSMAGINGLLFPPNTAVNPMPGAGGVSAGAASRRLPTTPAGGAGTVRLDANSVAGVATALAGMSPRVTTQENHFQVYDYDEAIRQAEDAQALSRLGGG